MTTNHPEKLDEALIRPGRVDHQVAFSNATQSQIQELFERMYTNDLPRTTKILKSHNLSSATSAVTDLIKTSSSITTTPPPEKQKTLPTPPDTPVTSLPTQIKPLLRLRDKNEGIDLSSEELSTIASQFAAQIPNNMFSPAEIQGFLLKRKTEPKKALREVEGWVKGMLEQKRKGTKLVNVQ